MLFLNLVTITLLCGILISVSGIVYLLISIADHIRFGVQCIRTPAWVLDWLSHNMSLAPNTVLYDIGCGDGTVLLYLNRAFPDVRMVGIEGALLPMLRAKWLTRKSTIAILHANYYTYNLSKGDIIFCFLSQHLMSKLEVHLRNTLKKGALVYSYAFTFPTWKPTKEIPHPSDPNGNSLFIYTND